MDYSTGIFRTWIASLTFTLLAASDVFAVPIALPAPVSPAPPASSAAGGSSFVRSRNVSKTITGKPPANVAETISTRVARMASGASNGSFSSSAAAATSAAQSRAAATAAAIAAAQARAAAAAAAARARAIAASSAVPAAKAAAAARSAAAQAAAVKVQAAAAAAAAKALADARAASAAARAVASAPPVTTPAASAAVPPAVSFPIIYDSAPSAGFVSPVASAARYLIVYQSDFSACDPAAQTDIDLDPDAVLGAIRRKISAAGYSEWGVLDIENPFDEILKAGPSDARFDSAVASLVNVIRAVRTAYPQMKWTYYAFPRVPYWMGVEDWGQLTQKEREVKYAEYARNFEPIMAEMDWFMPSLYDVYERAQQMPRCASPREVAEAEYRKACVYAVSRWFTRAGVAARPIIPVVSPWFQPGGVATAYKAIPMDEFCAEQVRPAIEAGASGMAIWGEMGFFLKMATASNLPAAQYVRDWQEQTRSAFASLVPAGAAAGAPSAPASPASIDWFAPSTAQAIGATLNESMSSAMRAIEARGITSSLGTN
jgi:hypothetical protein